MNRLAHLDCFSGISGDMLLGALVDAGCPASLFGDMIAKLGLRGVEFTAERVQRHGMAATLATVSVQADGAKQYRHLPQIRGIIAGAGLSESVARRAAAIFQRLAEAEAAAHGIAVDRVHFHEVGADDAIVDIVGACVGLEYLGADRITCSPIPVGSGTVTCGHGVLPIPAPATSYLLKDAPIAECDEPGELTTPTGAAIATTLAERFGPLPAMTIRAVGVGTGRRAGQTRPNLLRLFLGETDSEDEFDADTIVVLETHLDDATGQMLGHTLQQLLGAGALDAFIVPIIMKKGRPGQLVTVLCRPADAPKLESILFAETGTFGVRRHEARRTKLAREHVTVETPYGQVRIKLGRRGGETLRAWPEYDDCSAAAETHGVALRTVQEAALNQWKRTQHDSGGDE